MSAVSELNWLDREQKAIQSNVPSDNDPAAVTSWWFRLANWWHRRDLSFGDGCGMKLECTFQAKKLLEGKECEFCGDPATTVEVFDRAVFVCDQCKAGPRGDCDGDPCPCPKMEAACVETGKTPPCMEKGDDQ